MKLSDVTASQVDLLFRALASALAPNRFVAQRHDAEGHLREVITADGAHKLPRPARAVPTLPGATESAAPPRVQSLPAFSAIPTPARWAARSGLPTCPYCGVGVGAKKRDRHMRITCPKRPSGPSPAVDRASRVITRAIPTASPAPAPRRNVRQVTSGPSEGRSVRTNCRHCGAVAIPGDDTCYSCSG